MRIAAMQPYFLPYLGYFSLIAATDRFVVFDPVQYIRHGWINRNRILHPTSGEPQFITVPVAKHCRSTPIRDIQISDQTDWRSKILGQVAHYRRRAPFFDQAMTVLRDCLGCPATSIVELNVHSLHVVCDALQISFQPIAFNELLPEMSEAEHPGRWAVEISKAMGASEYINPVNGRDIFHAAEFAAAGVRLTFLSNDLAPYSQFNESFSPALSILDVLMFNGLKVTRAKILHDVQLYDEHAVPRQRIKAA
ncbi:WbqC family protein [Stieleria varia]|uniref:WbqC-like protein family protein n=1 Tax=Stieleria varia TaxID=2528005 RepID=A0A5C6B3A3_9BACT|nr:WbqC family protein [Stieleria varia]TWU05756.1 WbqC-like protein family protein [Stieleria varia]